MLKRFLDEFKPDVIVAPNFSSTQHVIAYKLAARRNIPMFGFAPSRIQGLNIWVHDYNYTAGPFVDRVHQLAENSVTSPNTEKAEQYISEFQKEFKIPIEEIWKDQLPSARGQLREFAKILLTIFRFY